MEVTLVGLQNAGKSSLLTVLSVSKARLLDHVEIATSTLTVWLCRAASFRPSKFFPTCLRMLDETTSTDIYIQKDEEEISRLTNHLV